MIYSGDICGETCLFTLCFMRQDYHVFMIITYILLVADWASTGMVANPARVVKLTETIFPPVRVCACELDVVTQVRPSRPSSARPFSTPRLNLAPTSGFLSLLSLLLLSATTASFDTANRHRVSPATKSGHAIMYIRRLLPRARRHRDCYNSSNQGSSSGAGV